MKARIGFLMLLVIGCVSIASAATTGSYYGSAKSITITKAGTVSGTLVGEYDPDDKTYSDYSGVYYLKFSLSRYKTCTLWGGNASVVDFSGASEEEFYDGDGSKYDDFFCPSLSFDTDMYDDTTARAIIYSDDWSSDDAKSVTYYVVVSGEIGDTFTLNYSPSIVEESIPTGFDPDHPGRITPSTTLQKLSAKLTENGYYLNVTGLKAAERTVFWVEDDTGASMESVSANGLTWEGFNKSGIPEENIHTAMVANVAGTYQVLLDGTVGDTVTLYYQKVADTANDD
ncbi:MAG: hypothetical protein J6U40_10130, partial [Kiritimatiellae bacterium]|nr:hypothetical protein [Kiritimatiellia bacterium]